MSKTNKDKSPDPLIDEVINASIPGEPEVKIPTVEELLAKDPTELTAFDMDILDENKDDLTDEQKVAVGLLAEDVLDKESEVEPKPAVPVVPLEPLAPPTPEETAEQKEQRYKAQQTEAQILAERNKQIASKVEEAAQLKEPTEEELQAFVRQDGVDWDDLTMFEKAQAKRSYLSEKKFAMVNDAVQSAKKIDDWANTVDEFIDSTDGKPEYLPLSGHEADFRKFAMQATHRGVEIGILLPAFLHNLPVVAPKRGSLFNRGGGGEKVVVKEGVTDAEEAARLRVHDPLEYKRQIKAGKIKLDI